METMALEDMIMYGWMALMSIFLLGMCFIVWTLDKDNSELQEVVEKLVDERMERKKGGEE